MGQDYTKKIEGKSYLVTEFANSLTKEQVVGLWEYMGRKYDFNVVQKASAKEMQYIAFALDAMGIQNKKKFMQSYTTTIGRTVYVPFVIGEGSLTQLRNQAATCVHEAQHVVQFDRDSIYFIKNYTTSQPARAHYEAEGYRCTMEMFYYLTGGKMLTATSLANMLAGYGVSESDIRVTRRHLHISSKVIRMGDIISNTSKTAIRWLNNHGFVGATVDFIK